MSQWDDEKKAKAVQLYTEGNPTPGNSAELCKQIAEELDQTANGVRMILMQAGVYVKKEAASGTSAAGKKSTEGSKRVSKEDSINELKEFIKDAGGDVDDDILDKLTGKAAVYLLGVFKAVNKE